MLTVLAVLAVGALVVNANPVDKDSDPAVYCVSARWNNKQFAKCRGGAVLGRADFSLEDLYSLVNQICKNRASIMQCMAKAMKSCRNIYVLGKITESSIGFCNKGKVDSVMANFLDNISGETFNGNCSGFMINEIIAKSGFPLLPEHYPTTLTGKLAMRRSHFDWYIDQFSQMDQTETIAACDGMTRQTVYGVILASATIAVGWGLDLYPDFVNIVQPTPNPWDV